MYFIYVFLVCAVKDVCFMQQFSCLVNLNLDIDDDTYTHTSALNNKQKIIGYIVSSFCTHLLVPRNLSSIIERFYLRLAKLSGNFFFSS